MTPRQSQTLRFIETYMVENVWPPTITEIAAETDVARSTAWEDVKALVGEGALEVSGRYERAMKMRVVA